MATTRIPFRFDSAPLLLKDLPALDATRCEQLIARIETSELVVRHASADFRDQDRLAFVDAELAQTLHQALKSHLPQHVGELQLCGFNDYIRLYRYGPGQRFLPHMDHWFSPDDRRITLYTVLVYLNDDFGGGATRFTVETFDIVRPKAGRAAVWQHKLAHEGMAVTSGVKYALRTDAMYLAPSPVELERGVLPPRA